MKIAILGYYYQNNAGDNRILHCLKKKIKELGVTEIDVFVAWDHLENKLDEINACDFLIIGGGGLILRKTNRIASLLEKLKIPFGFLGVSVDSIGEDNEIFVKYIANNSKFILVRDAFSFDTFKSYNNCKIFQGPDLTFLYPYKPNDAKNNTTNFIALSLRPWKPNIYKQFTKRYHKFNHLVHKFPIIIKILGLWQVEKFIKELKIKTHRHIIPFPLQINKSGGDNNLLNEYFPENLINEFNIDILKNSEYLIGMRLHSLIFATQVGIPFIGLNYASKVKNYAQTIDMQNYVIELKNYNKINLTLKELEKNKTIVSENLLKSTKKFELEIHQAVDNIFKNYIL